MKVVMQLILSLFLFFICATTKGQKQTEFSLLFGEAFNCFDCEKTTKIEKYTLAINSIDFSTDMFDLQNYFSAFLNRGVLYSEIKDYEAAKKDFQTAIKINSTAYKPKFLLANLLFDQKNLNGAVELYSSLESELIAKLDTLVETENPFIYEEREETNKNVRKVQYNLGIALLYLNKRNDACENFLKASKRGYSDAKTAYQQYCK